MPKKPERSNTPNANYQKLFETLGVEFRTTSGTDACGECPFCGGVKFYVNVNTGQYICHHGKCKKKGNALTLVRWYYDQRLNETDNDTLRPLNIHRDLSFQTLNRHGIAYDSRLKCYLVPFKNVEGDVMNLQCYYPQRKEKNKLTLPGLNLYLYGLECFGNAPKNDVIICEGPWDAIALDGHLRSKQINVRERYDILALPSANTFNNVWEHFSGRKVKLALDNDKAGHDGQQALIEKIREAGIQCNLQALRWPDTYPEKFDLSDLIQEDRINVSTFLKDDCHKVSLRESRLTFVLASDIPERKIEWLWPSHIPFSTFVSFSGKGGSYKSTITKDIVARVTAGLPMPLCDETTAHEPFHVLYFTSEDGGSNVKKLVELAGGDLSKVHIYDEAVQGPINLIDYLDDCEIQIQKYGARLVVLDALNSFTQGDIKNDAKARATLSGKITSLARKTGVCIIGVRNEGRLNDPLASNRALGATSLSAMARVVMHTHILPPVKGVKDGPDRPVLAFEKVSDAKPPRPIEFEVIDLSVKDDSNTEFHRKISWKKPLTNEEFRASIQKSSSSHGNQPKTAKKTVPKKVSKKLSKKVSTVKTEVKGKMRKGERT